MIASPTLPQPRPEPDRLDGSARLPVPAPPSMSPSAPRPARRRWSRRRMAAVLLVPLAVVLAIRVVSGGSNPAGTTTETAAPAPLIAHGQVQPTRQARVGSLAGGVVQQVNVSVGSQVSRQGVLAWVLGPNGTELVTAPLDGTITNILVHEGDTVGPGSTLLVVADLNQLQVELTDIDEFLVNTIQVGQVLDVTIDALDDAHVEGLVSSVALLPQSTGSTGNAAYPVILSLSGLPPDVRAGMSVRTQLTRF
jgi:multidrug efflux pump subunit AcrA (membrane-fusion protein)